MPADFRAPVKPMTPAVARLSPHGSIDGRPITARGAMPTPDLAVDDELPLQPLSTLSANERSTLPPLKVSMHVYAQSPAQRFMIIDGQRVGEGARIADGVTLVRIRRDGAEIDVRGRRMLLPNP